MKVYNDHNLYILGAGFSFEASMPLMTTYMTEIKRAFNWYPENSYARDSIEAILKFRQLSTSAAYRIALDLDNIEDLFSLAATEGAESVDLLRNGLCATLEYCQQTKTINIVYNINAKTGIPYLNIEKKDIRNATNEMVNFEISPYHYIAALISGIGKSNKHQLNSIISFNYDTVLEDSLDFIGRDYSYCLNHEINDLNSFKKLPVIKLHGSMNWVEEDGKIITKPFNKILENVQSPYIIPPIWTKSSSDVSQFLWKNAQNLISSATRIIIVGFSLPKTDLFFRYLLAAGLKENISLQKVCIVNPEYRKIKNDVEDLFANNNTKLLIDPYEMTTTSAFENLGFRTSINRTEERIIFR